MAPQVTRASYPTSSTRSGVIFVLLSCLSLQFGAAFAVNLFPSLGTWGTTLMRLGVAAVIMLLLVRPKVHLWSKQQWIASILLGVSMGAMNGVFFNAIALIPLGLAVALEFSGPLILSIILSRRPIDLVWSAVAGLGLCFLGYESFRGAQDINLLGVFLALLAGVFWALYILASAKVGRVIDGSGGLSVALAIGAIMMIPLGGSEALAAFADPKLLLFAVAVGILSSTLPYSFELAALRRLPRNVFSILLSLEPAFAELAGIFLLGQHTGWVRWTAIVLLIAASIGITRTGAPKQVSSQTSYEPENVTGALPAVTGFQNPESLKDPT